MDLLGGYGSSSDEENDQVQKASGTTSAAAAAAAAEPPNQSTTKVVEKPIAQKQQQRQGKINPRGRKILSLASVLPQHIFDQLTKSHVQGDVSDDDDDDHEDDTTTTTTEGAPKNQNAASKRSDLQVQKEGISSLLSDLQKAAPTSSSTSANASSSKSAVAPYSSKRQQQERMGAAFLQSTVVVETKKNSTGVVVRDIHAAEETDTVKPALQEDKNEVSSKNRTISVSTGGSHYLKPAPAAASSSAAAEPTAVSYAPQIVAAPTFTRVNPVPGMMPRAAAAPPIQLSSSSLSAGGAGVGGAQSSIAHSAPPPPPPSTATAGDVAPPRKRTRKEMERALRQGNLAVALESDANFSASLQQAPPDAYVPEPETYAVPQHGIKVVPTAMYDPSAGQAVQSASGKGRGKNQIHHLMASAANLELQRARGLGGGNAGKTHRANAKQKYGW